MIKTIAIDGMHCMHCVNAVTEALRALPGVEKVEVSLEDKHAVVTGGALDDAALRTAVEDIGFDVAGIS